MTFLGYNVCNLFKETVLTYSKDRDSIVIKSVRCVKVFS